MSWFVVHIPDDAMKRDGGDSVADVTAALADFYEADVVLGMRIESQDALNVGWCDACPTNCRQCTGDRSSCECYGGRHG
jgi:hypothetical protein